VTLMFAEIRSRSLRLVLSTSHVVRSAGNSVCRCKLLLIHSQAVDRMFEW